MTAATAPDATTADPHAVLVDGYLIQRFRILGTTTWVHQAWAPVAQLIGAPYTTLTHLSDQWWGRLGSERHLPAELEALPALSSERSQAARAWRDAQDERAYALIARAFPEPAAGRRSMGEVNTERS